MIVTAKDLRFKISMLFDVLSKGEDIFITYRGKTKAKLISFDENSPNDKNDELFGLWSDMEGSVDEMIRDMRKSRTF